MHLADGCKVGISEEAALLLRLPHRFHSVLPLGSPVVVLDLLGGANLHLPVQQSYKKNQYSANIGLCVDAKYRRLFMGTEI